ncbi:LysR family transcriptional regulator [Pantoea rwandensis]|uniref:LysR family transcriptional regulator n=1 Tax=Pantoea rwandensis TaxID=1076550 RepID=A0A1X1D0T3_9GAMM|nr:LysR family transcriptional regulator [Pantoea rwandensis]ORM70305.1 LysR family transcriptional regulator [Pantoea rwandensis]
MSHLTHLRTFLEAYRSGSFSRAAEQLGITQPAASLHIQSLEALVGKRLFIRQARGVSATEAADELARSVSPFIDGLEDKLSSFRSGPVRGGTVNLAGPPDFIHSRLGAVMAPLMSEGYRLRFHTGNKQRIYALLQEGSVDLAVTASMPDERLYGYAHLLTERMLLVHAPSMSEAIGPEPGAEKLASLPLIAYDEELPLIRTLWATLFQRAPDMQAAFTIPDLRIIRDLVCNGHGWTVLPDYHCTDDLKSGRLVSVTPSELAPTNHLYLVWNKRTSNNSRTAYVRDFILKAFPR